MRAGNSIALVAVFAAACSSADGVEAAPLAVRIGEVVAAGKGSYIASYVVTNHGTAPICLSTRTVNPKGIAQGEVIKFVLPNGSEKLVRDFPGFPGPGASFEPPRTYRLAPRESVNGSVDVPAYLADAAPGPTRFRVLVPAMECGSQAIGYLDWMDVGFGVQPDEPNIKAAKAQAHWARSVVVELAE